MNNKDYRYTLKNYAGTSTLFYTDSSYTFKIEIVKFQRPIMNSKWIETDRKIELVNNEFYFNTIEATPFFRSMGGYEKITCNYTKMGYIPTKVVSISPDKLTKIERRFIFE